MEGITKLCGIAREEAILWTSAEPCSSCPALMCEDSGLSTADESLVGTMKQMQLHSTIRATGDP
jgi:hypothetical protein